MIIQSSVPDFESRTTTIPSISMCGRVNYLSNSTPEVILNSHDNIDSVRMAVDSNSTNQMHLRPSLDQGCSSRNKTGQNLVNANTNHMLVKDNLKNQLNSHSQHNGSTYSIIPHSRSAPSSPKNELPHVFDRNALVSPQRKSPSPRGSRSSSPYSLSSMREPGNICSKNVQVAQEFSKESSSIENTRISRDHVTRHFASRNILSDENNERFENDNKDENQDEICNQSKLESEHETSQKLDENIIIEIKIKGGDENLPHPHIPITEHSINTPSNKSKSKNLKSEETKKDEEERKVSHTPKNESWIRIAHSLIDEFKFEKRVFDVRTIADLMEVYTTLKDPVILPVAIQHGFYDQWARFPTEEGLTRAISRSSTALSAKCLSLAQSIQEDQLRVTNAANENLLTVPNPADVTCKSLDSIIDHYNQMSYTTNHIFLNRTKTPPISPMRRPKSKISSGNQNKNHSGKINAEHNGNGDNREQMKEQIRNEKLSPVGRKKTSSVGNKLNKTDVTKSPLKTEPLKENPPLTSEKAVSTSGFFSSGGEFIKNKTNDRNPPLVMSKKASISSSTDDSASTYDEKKVDDKCLSNNNTINIGKDSSAAMIQNSAALSRLKTTERRGSAKDISRDPYEVTTSTMRLDLPHELTYYNKDGENNSGPSGNKRSSHQNLQTNNILGLNRRSKTKIVLSQIGLKHDRRENTFVSSNFYKNHTARQSLLVNEAIYGKDVLDSKVSTDYNAINRISHPRPATTFVKNRQKQPELPSREYSMCERFEPAVDKDVPHQISRLNTNPSASKSERQSALSLANVHFLDLSDLKTMLRKANTPIPKL